MRRDRKPHARTSGKGFVLCPEPRYNRLMGLRRKPWGAYLLGASLLVGCPGNTDSLDVEQSAASALDKMSDADLSTLKKVEQALSALGDQGGLSTILDPEEASFGQNEMMEMALLGIGFTDELVEDQPPSDEEPEAEAEKTPAENCADLQAALAKRSLTCPIVECSSSGNTFKNSVRGDCEGRDKRGDRFAVHGESVMEGTFDEAGGNIDARVMYRGFEVVFDRTLSPEGFPGASAKPAPKSISMQNSITAEGEVRWKARGATEGSLDFSGEVEGRLSMSIGIKFDVDGKTGAGDVKLKSSMGQKVTSKPERFTFESRYVQECEGKASVGTPAAGSLSNQASGSVSRNGAILTLDVSGRHGDSGMEKCMESPSKELQELIEEAYGADAATRSKAPAGRALRLLRLRRSHEEMEKDAAMNGKFSFKADTVVANPESCKREPTSGALTLSTVSQSVEIAFDGGTKCDGTAGVKINGKDSGSVQTGDFLPVGTLR